MSEDVLHLFFRIYNIRFQDIVHTRSVHRASRFPLLFRLRAVSVGIKMVPLFRCTKCLVRRFLRAYNVFGINVNLVRILRMRRW